LWFELAVIVQEISCPRDDRLLSELTNRKRKTLDKKGRRSVESKDDYKARGFRSPDVADGFLLAFYQPTEDARPRIWSLKG
jgi:phage terminase large subunit